MPGEVEFGKSKCMCLISWSEVRIKVKNDGELIKRCGKFVDACLETRYAGR